MDSFGVTIYLKLLIIYATASSLVDSLSLASQSTTRPRLKPQPEPPSATQSTTTTTSQSPSDVATYRLINRNTDATCILLTTDALVEINLKLHGFDDKVDSLIPNDAVVKGSCANEDSLIMELTWQWYSLSLAFAKTPGGELWYLSQAELAVSLDMPRLSSIQTRDKTLRLYSNEKLIPTPVGKSYMCDEVHVQLRTEDNRHPPKNIHGSLWLRKLQIQAFMYKNENFSESFQCKAQKYFRSETAPIAVGSTLAIAALGIVSGYGIYRYFKVKNVQYNAME
ncbi:uncharacterized protein LOC132698517 [Cylas formicarius]|uniref:uncharacterized protein LOC132698517 n=1 Tax=Cylas formicarius TaxID=197179 RepID=UPI00295881E7|nr:uncharacterized protein LOC132698517 [Cylas formicarius]